MTRLLSPVAALLILAGLAALVVVPWVDAYGRYTSSTANPTNQEIAQTLESAGATLKSLSNSADHNEILVDLEGSVSAVEHGIFALEAEHWVIERCDLKTKSVEPTPMLQVHLVVRSRS